MTGKIDEKRVYVWSHDRHGTTVDYYMLPPLDRDWVRSGDAKAIALEVDRVLDRGYHLVLDRNPQGEHYPLHKDVRGYFDCYDHS